MKKLIIIFFLILPSFALADTVVGTGDAFVQNIGRSFNTVYHNTTGSALIVSICGYNNSETYAINIYSDKNNPPTTVLEDIQGSRFIHTPATFVVSSDNYYKVTDVTGSQADTVLCWDEAVMSTTTIIGATTTTQQIDNVNEDYFFGVFLFFFLTGGIIFVFKKR
jgi:uncharacterized protein YcgI (DUF1989 family)